MLSTKETMIATQLNNRDIFEKDIINTFLSIDRTEFVPATFKRIAYTDIEIPSLYGVILRPFVLAKIAQFVSNSMKNKKILVIGDVSGYTGTFLYNISKACIIVTVNDAATEYLRNRVSLKVMQICDIKEKFDLIFFDSGLYNNETIIDISHTLLKQNGSIIKISGNLNSEFFPEQLRFFDISIVADFSSESTKILEMPLLLNPNYIS